MLDSLRRPTILLLGVDHPEWDDAREVLQRLSVNLLTAPARAEEVDAYKDPPCHMVIVDLEAVEERGETFLSRLRASHPEIPVLAVQARRHPLPPRVLSDAGVADVLASPSRTEAIVAAVQRLVSVLQERKQQRHAFESIGRHLEGIVGRSQAMIHLYEQMARAASSNAPVLITGETGTGKELLAGALHRASGRSAFVALNCSASPSHLLESELFGHARGSFAGALTDRRGLIEDAAGGTLFLDEIAELPLPLQPKLLHLVQSGEFRRLGEVKTRTAVIRLIAATHRDLNIEIEQNHFRDDLYYRINVLRLEIPALRERSTDIPLLAERFLLQLQAREEGGPLRIAPAAMAALVGFSWPGNVRQLQNVIERAALYTDRDEIRLKDLPREIREGATERSLIRNAADRGLTLDQLEKEFILEVLRRCRGNKSRAAVTLGVPRRTLYRRLEGYATEELGLPDM